MRWGIIIAAGLVTGCASTTWYHPGYSDTQARRQFAIDDGRCTAAASGNAPVPAIPISDTGYRSRQTSGSVYNRDGQYVGRYEQRSTAYSGGALSGAANGYNLGNAIRARGAQDRIYKGCMRANGWTTKRTALSAEDTPEEREARAERERIFNNPRPGSLADYAQHPD